VLPRRWQHFLESYPGGVWIISRDGDKQFEEMIDILKRMRINSSSRAPKQRARSSSPSEVGSARMSLDRDRSDRFTHTNARPASPRFSLWLLTSSAKRA